MGKLPDSSSPVKRLNLYLYPFGLTLLEDGTVEVEVEEREFWKRLAGIKNGKYKRLRERVGRYFAKKGEVDFTKIKPRLELIQAEKDSRRRRVLREIFQYAKSFWSVPVSEGVGRRMDFILWDWNVKKVMGIFGLSDPVFNLSVRDRFIGWSLEEKKRGLKRLLTAYILGAVPPYNEILGAKLVALASTSKEVAEFFKRFYKEELLAVDTMGAFGKSAIYTRLKGWKFIGYTKGYTHLHFTLTPAFDFLVEKLKGEGISKKEWNSLSLTNSRIRLVKKALSLMGLKGNKPFCLNLKRGYYFAPLCENFKEALKGKELPLTNAESFEEKVAYWKERWLIKRLKLTGRG